MTSYIVQSGDTLSKIAQKFYGDPMQYDYIAQWNGINSPYIIRIGQVLTIPPKMGTSTTSLSPFIARQSNTGTPAPSKAPLFMVGSQPVDLTATSSSFPAFGVSPPPVKIAAKSTGFNFTSLIHNKKVLIGGAIIIILAGVMGSKK